MSVVTNQNVSYQRLTETNYAGGDAGAARSLTKIAAVSTTFGFWCFRLKSTITMPKVQIERESSGGSLASNFKRYRKATKYKHIDGKTEHYLQDNSLITAALLTEGVNPSTSYVFHWQDGLSRFESYGCFISQYDLIFGKNVAPTQSCVWKCHNTKYATGVGTDVLSRSDVSLLDTIQSLPSNCDISIAGTSIIFDSATLTIKNENYEQEVATGMEHIITSKSFELKFNSVIEDSTHYNASYTETIGDETIVITTGKFTLTLTHCDVMIAASSESDMENGSRMINYEVFPTISTEVTLS